MAVNPVSPVNPKSQPFADQAVLVTGSSRGIGRAIAERLLAQGATVGIHGRSPEALTTLALELGGETIPAERIVPLAADLSEPAAAAELVERFTAAAGRIDGLVNNAGGGRAVAFRGLKLDGWRATFATNLESALLASQTAYVKMRKQRAGVIVNIASLAAHGPGKWMGADYAASKAALLSLTRSLALEAARFGIRVNAVSPGFVETEMTAPMPEANRDNLGIPLGRLAEPDEIASVVAFLLSAESRYMTGQVLHVDGGLWMHGG